MAIATYKRVSDEKQEDGVSFEMQQDEIEKYCAYKGYDVVKEYSEINSARTIDRRVELQKLLNHVREGRIKKIIIWKLDRITRSLRDLLNMLHELEEMGCELYSTHEGIDTTSTTGKMIVQVLGMVAEWESDNTSLRVSTAMNLRARQGIWQSSVPFGFYLGDDKRLKIRQDEADILREAFDMIREGNSCTSTSESIRKKYNLEWADNYLRRKIRHATTVGNIERNGKIYKNTHQGIITEKEQRKLLDILKNNRTGRRFIDHDDIFRRRIVCYECNSIMHVNARSHNDYKTISYNYVCAECYSAKRPFISVSESLLKEGFLKYMKNLKIINLQEHIEDDKTDKKIKGLKRQLIDAGKRRDRIQRAWISSRIKDDDLDKYLKEIEDEETLIEDELSKLSIRRNTITDDEIRKIRDYFNVHFEALSRLDKRAFVQRNIKGIEFSRKLKKGYKRRYDIEVTNVEFF